VIDMTYDDALEAIAGHPHAWRFLQLCESDEPEVRAAYRELVVRITSGAPPAGPPPLRVDYGDAPSAGARGGCCGG
jgi:hypothetical protein